MAMQDSPVTLFGKEYPNLKEALHTVTNDRLCPNTPEEQLPFYDIILQNLHKGEDVFNLGKPVTQNSKDTAVYTISGRPVTLADVTRDFLTRLTYKPCCMSNNFRVMPLLAMIRLSGTDISQQMLCSTVVDPPRVTTFPFSNVSGGKVSWFKLLIKAYKFSVVTSDKKIAKDALGNSVIDLAHPEYLKYVLQSVIDAGIDRVVVLPETLQRIQARTDQKFLDVLAKLTIATF